MHVVGVAAVAIAVIAASALAGCTASRTVSETGTPGPFTGPYASEIADGYNSATDDFTRAVLADGKVTEQERSEMVSKFTACLDAAGVTLSSGYRFDGSYDTSFPVSMGPDAAHSKTMDCSRSSGEDLIGSTYNFTHRNPDNLDDDTIVANCLVNVGIAPTGYSGTDYAQNASTGIFPFDDQDALQACRVDPLGLQGTYTE